MTTRAATIGLALALLAAACASTEQADPAPSAATAVTAATTTRPATTAGPPSAPATTATATAPTASPAPATVDELVWIGDDGDVPLWVRGPSAATVAVVVVPGGPGLGGIGTFDPSGAFADALGTDVLLALYDPRSAGGLRPSAGPADVSVGALAAELDDVVEHVRSTYRPREVVLVGHSFGGQVAIEHAAGGGEVDGLVLMSTTVDERANAELMRTEALRRIAERRAAGDVRDLDVEDVGVVPLDEVEARLTAARYDPLVEADHVFAEGALTALGGELFADGTDPTAFLASRSYDALPAPFDVATLIGNLDASEAAVDDDELWRLDLRAAAGRITVPVLMVHGTVDGVFPAGNVDVTRAALTSTAVEVAIVPTGHFPQIEAPAATAAAIDDFLS